MPQAESAGRPSASWSRPGGSAAFSPRRLGAYAIREALELWRDPIRLGFALLGTAFLMLVIGFGITTDVDNLAFAVLDRDQTPQSRTYLEELRGSRYFTERAPITDGRTLQRRLESADIRASIEIPPGFGRKIKAGQRTEVGVWLDGAMPFRAETSAAICRPFISSSSATWRFAPARRRSSTRS